MAVSAKVAEAYIDLVARTETFKKALNEADALVKQTASKMRADMAEAKGSIALLGEEFGVHLPRHLRTFVAELPGVSAAMATAFSAVAVYGLAKVVIETAEHISEFAKKNEEAARKSREAWQNALTPISDTNDKLELTKTKLENAIAKIEHKPQNKMKEAIEEATVAADELGRHLDSDIQKIAGALAEQQRKWFGSEWLAQTFLKQTGSIDATEIAKDAQNKFNQIAAGTYEGPGKDQTSQRDSVIWEALSNAYGKLGPARQELKQRYPDGKYPATSSLAQEVTTLTELIAGLKAMQTTSSLTQEVATLQGKKDQLEGAEDQRKHWGSMVMQMVKESEDAAKEQKRIGHEVEEFGERQLSEYLDAKVRANREEEEADKQKAAQFKENIQAQIQQQRDLIAAAAERYRDIEKSSALRVRGGVETPEARSTELAGAARDESAAKIAAYNTIIDLLFSIGKGTSPEAFKAADEASRAEREGQEKLFEIHAEYSEQIRAKWLNALSGVNQEIASLLTGQRTNWSGMFRGEASRYISSGLSKVENAVLFGSHKKADGYHMWVDNLPGASASGNVVSSAGKGLLGILNDSNWFGSLFGGRLFGAGSIFGGGHALGGDVAAGVPIDVGELGRERFTPLVPGRITSHADTGRGAPLIGYIDARGTDPALSRENFTRALVVTHRQAVHDASRAMAERSRRVPR